MHRANCFVGSCSSASTCRWEMRVCLRLQVSIRCMRSLTTLDFEKPYADHLLMVTRLSSFIQVIPSSFLQPPAVVISIDFARDHQCDPRDAGPNAHPPISAIRNTQAGEGDGADHLRRLSIPFRTGTGYIRDRISAGHLTHSNVENSEGASERTP